MSGTHVSGISGRSSVATAWRAKHVRCCICGCSTALVPPTSCSAVGRHLLKPAYDSRHIRLLHRRLNLSAHCIIISPRRSDHVDVRQPRVIPSNLRHAPRVVQTQTTRAKLISKYLSAFSAVVQHVIYVSPHCSPTSSRTKASRFPHSLKQTKQAS